MDNYLTLDDVFLDPVFQEMFVELRPKKVERPDPEVEKFQELLGWVREQGHEPSVSGSFEERLKARYLKGLRQDADRRARCLPYDDLGLLGGEHG